MKKVLAISIILLAALATMAQTELSENLPADEASAQALKVFNAIQKQDRAETYRLSQFSAKLSKTLSGAAVDEFVEGFRQAMAEDKQGANMVNELLSNMTEITAGRAVVNGDKAEVPTSCRITLKGQTLLFKGVAKMIRSGKNWKWDLTSSDDPALVMEQGLTTLVGEPQQ